jgi:hypothetical protein
MKKIITIIIFIFPLSASHAQKISEAEAQQYLEKVWSYLKTSDTVAFVNLWLPEDSVWEKNHPPIDKMKSFHFLRTWLEPAITKNLNIDHVEIGETTARGTELKAYLKAREHAFIGFSFFVVSVNDKWSARGKPGYFAGSK